MSKLQKYGKLRSAKIVATDFFVGDVARDLTRNARDVAQEVRDNPDEWNLEDAVWSEMRDLAYMDLDEVEGIAEGCANHSDDMDEAVACMVENDIPRMAALTIGEETLRYSEEILEDVSKIDWE